MKLRKILNAALGFALCFSCLAGCGKKWETGEGGRGIYPGGDGMDDIPLEFRGRQLRQKIEYGDL